MDGDRQWPSYPLILIALAAALISAAWGPVAAEAGDACPDQRYVEGVGRVCDGPGRLLEVVGPDGRRLGFTHGPDPMDGFGGTAGSDGSAGATGDLDPAPPTCVGPDQGARIHVIYARAHDDADRYASMVDRIREMVGQANAKLMAAAEATGRPGLRFKVVCDASSITVENETLPTPKADADLSTIKGDLLDKGYDDPQAKYLVYYDDPEACGCAGVAEIYDDDRPGPENWNNGNGNTPLYAIDYGIDDHEGPSIVLHELSHSLGAVQNSAPHATERYHCTDGLDVMCYNDGSETGANYTTSACPEGEVYDCGHDDYCHAGPQAGSYLATHWNLCGQNNSYIDLGAPVMVELSCTGPVDPGQATRCSMRATGAGPGLAYSVTWDDGSPVTRVPATGYVEPDTTQATDHTFEAGGWYTVSVQAEDNATPARVSDPLTTEVRVTAPPTLETVDCPSQIVANTTTTCTLEATDPDPGGVFYTVDWGDGTTSRIPASGEMSPGVPVDVEHTYTAPGEVQIAARATDDTGLTSQIVTRDLDVIQESVPPTIGWLDPRPGHRYQGCDRVEAYLPALVDHLGPPIFQEVGCVHVSVKDPLSGVAEVIVHLDGQEVARLTAPNTGGDRYHGTYQVEVATGGPSAEAEVTVEAIDRAGNAATATRTVVTV